MKSQSACHFCSWKECCFPSKTAMVQDCSGSSWNTKPLSVALSILLVWSKCVLTTVTTAKNNRSHPPAHMYLSSWSKHSLFTMKHYIRKKEIWKKHVKIIPLKTIPLKLIPLKETLFLSRRFPCKPLPHRGVLPFWSSTGCTRSLPPLSPVWENAGKETRSSGAHIW